MLPPERAFWPLWPLPEVLPWPSFRRSRGVCAVLRARHVVLDRADLIDACFRDLSAFRRECRGFSKFHPAAQSAQRFDRGLDHVGVIAGTERLRQHVANADRLHHRADAATRDDAGSRRSRPRSTRPPPNSPMISCGMVFSCSDILHRFFADSEAFRIASLTSFALPKPKPTWPS